MNVRTLSPTARLAPFVRSFEIVEASEETTRALLPETGVVLGLRYRGAATLLDEGGAVRVPDRSFAGLRATARRMRTAAGSGLVVAKLREGAASAFFREPLHELFGATLALGDLLRPSDVERASSRIAEARTDAERVAAFEELLSSCRRASAPDPVALAAVRAIAEQRGALRIGALAERLGLGQDALEKRFRRAVGASPKRFASIVRLRHAIASYRPGMRLSQVAVEAEYFDQSHFVRELRAATGQAPQQFFRSDAYC